MHPFLHAFDVDYPEDYPEDQDSDQGSSSSVLDYGLDPEFSSSHVVKTVGVSKLTVFAIGLVCFLVGAISASFICFLLNRRKSPKEVIRTVHLC